MKYKLELEEEEYDYEGWAFLHFHTQMPGVAFANSLNQLYDYSLRRVDDIPLADADWPLYRYEDTLGKHIYFLVERPVAAVASPWDACDKLLLVKGKNAAEMASRIVADFIGNTAAVDDHDLLACERADLLAGLLANFTVVNLLDFTAPTTSRKATKERALVQNHCDSILAHIEQKHLDLSEDERMRLEMRSQVEKTIGHNR